MPAQPHLPLDPSLINSLPSSSQHLPTSRPLPPHSSPRPSLPLLQLLGDSGGGDGCTTTTSGTMSEKEKDCGSHFWWKKHKFHRIIFSWILAFIILILFIILVIWLVLRPTKPKFYLQDASVYAFNVSSPDSLLTSTLQVTISTRNPNDRVGIYYDRVDVFASYKYQQITLATAVPPFYQGHNDIDIWSPYLYGVAIPVAPYLAEALVEDQSSGFLLLHVKIDGRVRWKVGTWISGHYHLFVTCPAFLSFETPKSVGDAPAIKFREISTCSVDV